MEPEAVVTTTEEVAPSLNEANQGLRKAVQERLARTATAAPYCSDNRPLEAPVAAAHAALGPEEYTMDEHLRPGQEAFFGILKEVADMHKKKAIDYGTTEDSFANIRLSADVINAEPYAGAILRMSDKMHRLKSFFHNGSVQYDGVEDTLLDLCSYSAIALALYREAQGIAGKPG